MAYKSLFAKPEKEDKPVKSSPTGYKPLFSGTEPTVAKPPGEIVNKTLPAFLGGGTYKMEVGSPNKLIKTERTDYGGLPAREGFERADIFPVSLGGVNASSTNITYERLFPEEERKPGQLTKTDKYLAEVILPQYKAGVISLGEARVLATSYLRDEQEGLNKQMKNLNLGGKVGEFADKAVGFFKSLGKKQPEKPVMRFEVGAGLNEQDKKIADQIINYEVFKGAEEQENKPLATQLKEKITYPFTPSGRSEAAERGNISQFEYESQAKALSDVLNKKVEPYQYDEEIKKVSPEEKNAVRALVKADNVESLAKIGTAPVRFLAGYPAAAIVSAALEFADEDASIDPKTMTGPKGDMMRLLIGDTEVKRLMESDDMYGIIGRSAGMPAALAVMAILENPFIAGTGLKGVLKSAIKKEGYEQLSKIGIDEYINILNRTIREEAKIGRISEEVAERVIKEINPAPIKTLEPQIKPQEVTGEALIPKTTKPLAPAKKPVLKAIDTEITDTLKPEAKRILVPAETKIDTSRIVIEPTTTNKNVARQQEIVNLLSEEDKAGYLAFKRKSANDFYELQAKFDELKKKYNLDAWDVQRKSDGRAIEKAYDDYQLNFSRLGDMNRGAFIINDFKQIKPLVDDIKADFRIRKIKNRFEDSSYGYRDILVSVRMSDGTKAEIQIMTPAMSKAKQELHSLYEPARVLESKKRNAFLTPSEYKEYKKLVKEQEVKYGKAWEDDVKLGFADNRADLVDITKKQPSQFKLDNLNNIVKKIKEGGGETINLKTGESLTGKKLYAVSPYSERSFIFKPGEKHGGLVANIDGKTIYEFAQRNADLLNKPNHALGFWFDKESGNWYFDVVVAPKSKKVAVGIGKKENQKAIFDLKKFEEIQTGGTGEAKKGGVLKRSQEIEKSLVPKKKPVLVKKKTPSKTFESRVYDRAKKELPDQLVDDVSYRRKTLKQEVKKAVNLIENDTQKAYNVAMGNTNAPLIERNTTNIALAEKALKEENYKLYAQLTKNRSLRLTEYGQAIVSEKGAINDNGLSRFVKQVISDRLDNLGKNALSNLKGSKNNVKKATEAIKNEVAKAKEIIKKTKVMDLADAQRLIDSLACK